MTFFTVPTRPDGISLVLNPENTPRANASCARVRLRAGRLWLTDSPRRWFFLTRHGVQGRN